MATDDTGNPKKVGKGFAGLTSMVSDVDATLETHAATNRSAAPAPAAGSRPQSTRSANDQEQNQYPKPSPPSSSAASGLNWILAVAAVVGGIWFVSNLANKQAPRLPGSYTGPSASPAASAAPSPRVVQPAPVPATPSRPTEEKPPPGRDNVLSVAQIRYCLSEDIRIDASKAMVNSYDDSDVDRFNAMVSDYNSRCGSFKYRQGALESARSDVEAMRSSLQSEGQRRFLPKTSVPASNNPYQRLVTTMEIQERLNALGYDAGAPDGLVGPSTRSAIARFQADHGMPPTGAPSESLLEYMNQSSR